MLIIYISYFVYLFCRADYILLEIMSINDYIIGIIYIPIDDFYINETTKTYDIITEEDGKPIKNLYKRRTSTDNGNITKNDINDGIHSSTQNNCTLKNNATNNTNNNTNNINNNNNENNDKINGKLTVNIKRLWQHPKLSSAAKNIQKENTSNMPNMPINMTGNNNINNNGNTGGLVGAGGNGVGVGT